MKIVDCEQGSIAWREARRCKVTGTRLQDVMGTSLARVQLIAELIAEEVTEQTKTFRVTAEMERGTAEEPFAIRAFQEKTGKAVEAIGFCISDEFDWVGYSPDGGWKEAEDYEDFVEIKNPNSDTAVFYQLTNVVGMEKLGLGTYSRVTKDNPVANFVPSSKNPFLGIPSDYKWQVVHAFIVNEKLQRLHFIVHDARVVDESKRVYVVVVERNNEILQDAIREAREALIEFRADWLGWKEAIYPSNF